MFHEGSHDVWVADSGKDKKRDAAEHELEEVKIST
jgi:hypothetical protein